MLSPLQTAPSSTAALGRTQGLALDALSRTKSATADKTKSESATAFLDQMTKQLSAKGLGGKGLVVDMDGDGTDEVLLLDNKGGLRVYRQNEDGAYTLDESSDSHFNNVTDIKAEDANNDGKIDSITLTRGDINVKLLHQKAGITSTSESWVVDPKAFKIFNADVNGDGNSDEVIVDIAKGEVHVTAMDENGAGETKSFSIGKLADMKLELVDDDKDGVFELRATGNTTYEHKTNKIGDTLYERTMRTFDEANYNLFGDDHLRDQARKEILAYVKASGRNGNSYSQVFDV